MADEDDFPRGRGAEPTALEYRRLAAQAAHDVTGEEVNFQPHFILREKHACKHLDRFSHAARIHVSSPLPRHNNGLHAV